MQTSRLTRGFIALLAATTACIATPASAAPPAHAHKTKYVVCWDDSKVPYGTSCPTQPTPEPAPEPTPEPAPEPTPEPAPEPTPEPAPSGDVFTPSLAGLPAIPSNFDRTPYIVTISMFAKSAAPDVVGAFRFTCKAGQLLNDDPIVYPGQPGKSHLHQFYGNTAANANSTYSSLRQFGQSTCHNPLNRSAYWMPAMLDGKGNAVRPDHIQVYYKRRPASDPKCSLTSGDPKAEGNCVPLPNGLRFIFGFDMLTGKVPSGELYFMCSNGTVSVPDSSHKTSIPAAMSVCPIGGRLSATIKAADCWDGKRLDSANHRDHVAHSGYGTWGYRKCDSGHPYVIPGFTLTAIWPVTPELKAAADENRLILASDAMHPELPAGSTFHADWWGAWDDPLMATWMEWCINKMLNCSSGDLGNSTQLKNVYSKDPYPAIVPIDWKMPVTN